MAHGPWHHSFLSDFSDVLQQQQQQQQHTTQHQQQQQQQHQQHHNPQQQLSGSALDLSTSATAPAHGHNVGGQGGDDRMSARRMHKADREKLRRDKLNEQFSELAKALDPDRPKNDKATILGESIQVVKELREEVKRLKTEHSSLLDESTDLTQEKNELQEERTTLKNETERLQNQLQQRIRSSSSPWMGMDPSLVMGGGAAPPLPPQPPYSYPIAMPQQVSVGENDSHQYGGGGGGGGAGARGAVNPTSTYIPIAPPMGAFPIHHPYAAVFGNRHGDGGNAYMPFGAFPPQTLTPSHSHIERPYAQYPTSVQPPVPGGYVVQIPPNLASQIPATVHSNQDSRSKSKQSNNKDLPQSVSSQQHTPLHEQGQCNNTSPAAAAGAAAVRGSDIRTTGSQDTTAAGPPDHEWNERGSSGGGGDAVEINDGKSSSSSSISSPSINSSTSSAKKKMDLDAACLTGTSAAQGQRKDMMMDSHKSRMESGSPHDPTLRPPAA